MCTISSELLVVWADWCWINWSSKVPGYFFINCICAWTVWHFLCVKCLFDLSHLSKNKNWQQTNGNGGQINNGSDGVGRLWIYWSALIAEGLQNSLCPVASIEALQQRLSLLIFGHLFCAVTVDFCYKMSWRGCTTLSKQAQKLIMASGSGFTWIFCFKICDEIDHVTGAIFVVSF